MATKFVDGGFKVALGSRSGGGESTGNTVSIKVDVTKPDEVTAAFAKSEQELGAPVNIVVYNGMSNGTSSCTRMNSHFYSISGCLDCTSLRRRTVLSSDGAIPSVGCSAFGFERDLT